MKKSFLIAGIIACIGATNTYADIVISQTNDNPDTTITVARAAKASARVKKDSGSQLQMTPDGGVVAINCPADCSGDCYALNNLIICECKRSDGTICDVSKDDVVVGSSSSLR